MFRYLESAIFAEGTIQTRQVPSSRTTHPTVESAIETAWTQALSRPGVHLFDGALCRFEGMSREGETLIIDLSPTTYRIVVGTNFAHPEFVDIFGPLVMANPVGVSTALLTRDNFLMMGRRNGAVAYYPHRVHPFAGSLEVQTRIDVFANIRRELREELSLEDGDILSITCLGVSEDLYLRHPETIFITQTSRTRLEIETRLDPAEHQGTWYVEASNARIKRALEHDESLTPIASSLLAAWLRWRG